jgi:hypothetical protein
MKRFLVNFTIHLIDLVARSWPKPQRRPWDARW